MVRLKQSYKIKDKEQRNEIIALVVKTIAAMLGSNDELEGVGHKISTQTVSGVGANVGVVQQPSPCNGLTKAVIATVQNSETKI